MYASLALLTYASVRVCGERLQLAANRPRRLKSILQDAGMPAWKRRTLPLAYCGYEVVAAPGIGFYAAFRATPRAAGVTFPGIRATLTGSTGGGLLLSR